MDVEKKKAIKVLRSLIISNPLSGVYIKNLLSDFRESEGFELPLFGHKSAVELLHASGEFFIENNHRDYLVYAKTINESRHISKLVSEQIKNKPRKSIQIRLQNCVQPQSRHFPSKFDINEGQQFNKKLPHQSQYGAHCQKLQEITIGVPQHKKAPTIEFSFEQLKYDTTPCLSPVCVDPNQLTNQRGGSVSRYGAHCQKLQAITIGVPQHKKSPTIEFSFEQLKFDTTPCLSPVCVDPNQLTNQRGGSVESSERPTGKLPEINNDDAECSTVANCMNDDVYIEDQQEETLELPWEEKYWSLFITHCISTSSIWGKLFGKHCRHDLLAAECQLDLLAKKEIVTVFNVGQIYLTLISGICYRVRLDNVDHSKKQISCFFIDEGDQRWLHMSEIYNCHSKFMRFPPQAICFALYGFGDFTVNDYFIQKHLINTVLNKPLTGKIYSTKDDFMLHKAAIQVILYNGSSDLNSIIIKSIYGDNAVPKLVKSNLTPVNISHIADDGTIFCQLRTNHLNYVNNLMKEFIRKTSVNPFLPLEKTVAISIQNLFVVCDDETNVLYRAKIVNESKGTKTLFYIDYGIIKTLPLKNMYCVESDEDLLKFPPQAIRTKLSGISNVPKSLVARLRKHFSVNNRAYVRNMRSDTIVSEVKLYVEMKSFMVCLNDSVELENERDELTDDVCADDLDINSNNLNIDGIEVSEATSTVSNIKTFEPPKLNSCFEVIILQTESPSKFVIKPIKYMSQWQEQMKSLQNYCKKNTDTMQLDMIKEGEPYACLKSNGYWHRAFIKFHRTKIYAFYCDISDIDNIDDVKKIKFLPDEYRTIPKLAISAKLFGIKPLISEWDIDVRIQFNKFSKGKVFKAIVEKIINDEKGIENAELEIRLMYESQCINDLFVESGRALRI